MKIEYGYWKVWVRWESMLEDGTFIRLWLPTWTATIGLLRSEE